MLPPIGAFIFKLLHFLWLYSVRVPCTFKQRIGAALAGRRALTHTIATGIISELFTSSKPFLRTPKCERLGAVMKGLMMARGEALMMLGLFAAVAIQLSFGNDQTEERLVWAVLLVIQTLPYAVALILTLFIVMPEGFGFSGSLKLGSRSPQANTAASNFSTAYARRAVAVSTFSFPAQKVEPAEVPPFAVNNHHPLPTASAVCPRIAAGRKRWGNRVFRPA